MAKKKPAEEVSSDAVLDTAVAAVRKRWGITSLYVPGEENTAIDKDVMSTGISPLDKILGNGGLAKGTLCLQIIAEAQKQGIKTLFIDQEQALNTDYASRVGADITNMYIAQPDSMEMGLGILEGLVRTGQVGLVIVDSLASMVPEAELQMDILKQGMAIQAKKMSEWLRRFNPVIARTNTIVIFTNQMREKVGVMYGSPKTTPGGKALKFYASYRLEVKVKERITDAAGTVTGNVIEITTVKNKKFPPYKSTEVNLVFGEGVDIIDVLIDDAVEIGLMGKSGTWYTVIGLDGESHQKQGKANMKAYILENPDLLDMLKENVLIDNVHVPSEDGAI